MATFSVVPEGLLCLIYLVGLGSSFNDSFGVNLKSPCWLGEVELIWLLKTRFLERFSNQLCLLDLLTVLWFGGISELVTTTTTTHSLIANIFQFNLNRKSIVILQVWWSSLMWYLLLEKLYHHKQKPITEMGEPFQFPSPSVPWPEGSWPLICDGPSEHWTAASCLCVKDKNKFQHILSSVHGNLSPTTIGDGNSYSSAIPSQDTEYRWPSSDNTHTRTQAGKFACLYPGSLWWC